MINEKLPSPGILDSIEKMNKKNRINKMAQNVNFNFWTIYKVVYLV